MNYQPRTYRRTAGQASGLVAFEVVVRETDLLVLADRDLTAEASELARRARADIERQIALDRRFAESWVPVAVADDAPAIVRAMAQAAEAGGVGPMAAVAGAVAEYVARGLMALSREVIVENGGDDFLVLAEDRVVGIEAGPSPLSGKVGLGVTAAATPLGIATSSATVGPSVSLGRADAVTVLAPSGALADAVATTAGNLVRGPKDVEAALAAAVAVPGVLGAVIIAGETMGARGTVELVRL